MLTKFGDPESHFSELNRRERIAHYIRRTSNIRMASLYIDTMLVLDEVRDKLQNNSIEVEKYAAFIRVNPNALAARLYYRYKVFVFCEDLRSYHEYCNERKTAGVSFEYIAKIPDYKRFQTRGQIAFHIIANYYFNNPDSKLPKNLLANILAALDAGQHGDKIVSLFETDIADGHSLRIRQKSVIDLANFYLRISDQRAALDTITSYFSKPGVRIDNFRTIGFALRIIRECKIIGKRNILKHIHEDYATWFWRENEKEIVTTAHRMVADRSVNFALRSIRKYFGNRKQVINTPGNLLQAVTIILELPTLYSGVSQFIHRKHLAYHARSIEQHIVWRAHEFIRNGDGASAQSILHSYFSEGIISLKDTDNIRKALATLWKLGIKGKAVEKIIPKKYLIRYWKAKHARNDEGKT